MKHTAEHNQRISEALKGKAHSPAHIAACSNARRGYVWQRECLKCRKAFETTGSRSWVCDGCRSVSTVVHCSRTTFQTLLKVQKGVCALCGEIPLEGRRLHVDHCHKTGIVRGLLCSYCNRVAVPVLERFASDHTYLIKPPATLLDGEEHLVATPPPRRPPPKRTTQQPGVAWHKGVAKWRAYGKKGGKQTHLGLFDGELEAAQVAKTWRESNG